jgi:hypothetical protein
VSSASKAFVRCSLVSWLWLLMSLFVPTANCFTRFGHIVFVVGCSLDESSQLPRYDSHALRSNIRAERNRMTPSTSSISFHRRSITERFHKLFVNTGTPPNFLAHDEAMPASLACLILRSCDSANCRGLPNVFVASTRTSTYTVTHHLRRSKLPVSNTSAVACK